MEEELSEELPEEEVYPESEFQDVQEESLEEEWEEEQAEEEEESSEEEAEESSEEEAEESSEEEAEEVVFAEVHAWERLEISKDNWETPNWDGPRESIILREESM